MTNLKITNWLELLSKVINIFYYCLLIGFIAHLTMTHYRFYDEVPWSIDGFVLTLPEGSSQTIPTTNLNNAEESTVYTYHTKTYVRMDFNEFSDFATFEHLWYILINTLSLFCWVIIFWLIRGLMKSVANGNIFNRENINKVRLMSLTMFISPFLTFYDDWLLVNIIQGGIVLNGYDLFPPSDLRWEVSIYALIVLVLVEIFRQGILFKEDSELAV